MSESTRPSEIPPQEAVQEEQNPTIPLTSELLSSERDEMKEVLEDWMARGGFID